MEKTKALEDFQFSLRIQNSYKVEEKKQDSNDDLISNRAYTKVYGENYIHDTRCTLYKKFEFLKPMNELICSKNKKKLNE